MGLAPRMVRELFRAVQNLNREGVTVLLVEQNARMALRTSHRAYVLETGQVVLSGQRLTCATTRRFGAATWGTVR